MKPDMGIAEIDGLLALTLPFRSRLGRRYLYIDRLYGRDLGLYRSMAHQRQLYLIEGYYTGRTLFGGLCLFPLVDYEALDIPYIFIYPKLLNDLL